MYARHELTCEIIFSAPVNSFEWHVVEGIEFEHVKTAPKHDVTVSVPRLVLCPSRA